MYSVVLMAAMTVGPADVPQFGKHRGGGCSGCTGCCGGCSGCSGCCGGGCSGSSCCGGGGCGGGCAGYASGYGYSNGYAAPGAAYAYGPFRSAGHAGWWGMVENYPVPPARPYGTIVYGPAVWGADYMYSGSTPYVRVTPVDEPKKNVQVDATLGGSARILIEVPEGAKLTVDGNAMKKSANTQRLFYTPKLEAGQTYFYDISVEVDGEKPVTRRVYVHSNEIVRASFQTSRMNSTGLASK